MPLAATTNQVVGGRLREARKTAGLTQNQVAGYMGVAHSQVSYWENGKRPIDLASLTKMADLFGYELSWFLGDDSESRKIAVSYRTGGLSKADLETVAWATRFVKNIELLKHLLEDCHEEQHEPYQ